MPELWKSITADYPPAHFRGVNLTILETLCRAADTARQCDELLMQGVMEGGRPHPALRIRSQAWADVRSCATKLRLAISSVMRSEAAAARPDPKQALAKPWQ